jgi:hypothetical protein
MVTPLLKKVFESEGIDVIPVREGAECLVKEISSSESHVELVIFGGPIQEEVEVSDTFEKTLSVEEFPVLKSHVLDGKAVLPTVLMIEMFAHVAMDKNPDLKFCGFDDLQVHKGILLSKNDSTKMHVLAEKAVKKDDLVIVPVELKSSANGKEFKNASAKIVLSSKLPNGETGSLKTDFPTYKGRDYYKDFLFHGSDLQGIKKIDSSSDNGLVALSKTAPDPSAWIKKPFCSKWATDPMVLDVGFQLLGVWSYDHNGAFSLPTFAARYRQFMPFPKENVKIVTNISKKSEGKISADIEFMNNEGKLIAKMDDYGCLVSPALKAAFAKNQLN